ASAAGAQVLKAFERLGVSDQVRAKLMAQSTPAEVVKAVADGEAELGVFLISVLTAPGLDVVGPLPAEVQQEVVFVAAIAENTARAEPARAFIAFLTSAEATATLAAKGLSPP